MHPDAAEIARARARWLYRGDARPPFAHEPGPGQESVWDYPRPPRIEPVGRRVRVEFGEGGEQGEQLIADSTRALRVLETAGPPTFYLPPDDVRREWLVPASGASHCEWKGLASYWSVGAADPEIQNAAWSYADPYAGFEALRDYLSFYPARVRCWLDDERVQPQPGGFYGGWVTSELCGPFKGEPGSEDW